MPEVPDPVERGVPLSSYAAVMAHVSEGIALAESLAHLGLGAEDWAAAEEAWLERIASGDPELLDAFDAHRKAAQALVSRALAPLDTDARGYCAFLRGFTGAPDPRGFLTALGMREGDLFRLIDLWQARMAGDAAVRKELLELLAEPAGPVPAVRPAKPALRQRRVLPSPSLAETSLALALDLPALPFTKPAPGAPPPVFAPSPAPAPAASLGETKLALGGVDKPVLPFVRKEGEAAPPEVPEVKPAAVAVPETTAPAFKVDLPAIPFTKAAPPRQELGTTAPAFKVDSPVLPFDKGAPPKEASLGETAPAFKVDKPVLPFGEEAKAKEPPQRTPFGVGLGETAPVLRIDLKALPFAKSTAAPAGPALPEPKLTLEAYATMCAEIWLDPPRAGVIAARYGLTAETKPAEDAAWQGRFAGNQALKTAWERLAIEAGQRIRGGK